MNYIGMIEIFFNNPDEAENNTNLINALINMETSYNLHAIPWTEKYEQLCEICNKIYHNNNQIHTMYTVVIISLFIIIMMLLKKVLK